MKKFTVVLAIAIPSVLLISMSTAPSEDDINEGILKGTVRDSDSRPVQVATANINRCEGVLVDRSVMRPGVLTDEEGNFEMRVKFRGEALTVKEIWVKKSGFVCIKKECDLTLRPKATARVEDFTLQKGEVLAGKVTRRYSAFEKKMGAPRKKRFHLIVASDSYRTRCLTDEGGTFEIYVPKGVYTIEVPYPNRMRAEAVKSGTRGILIEQRLVVASPELLQNAFDGLWESMDRHYSYFFLKKVDWKKLKEEYRSKAIEAKSLDEFVETLKEMLAHLKDPHVWIDTEQGLVSPYGRGYKRNWNPETTFKILETRTDCGQFAIVGKTKEDGFGYLIINKQSAADPRSVQQTIEAVQKLRDVPGFLVDLRGGASGGNERLAQKVAGLFCSRDTVYGRSKYRSGPAHQDFTKAHDRILKAGKQPFTKPVVCLIGSRCMSSGEGFVLMMKALPNVKTVGEPTRGASGNPKAYVLPDLGISVWYSRWVDMLPDGTWFEGVGIQPDIEVSLPVKAYQRDDPTLQKGLEVLREMVREERSTEHRTRR